VELLVLQPLELERAAALVGDRHDAVHAGILLEQVKGPDLFRDVLAGAGRAVDGADDRNVIAGAVTAVAPIIAHEVTRLGRRRRGRAVPAKGIIPLERPGTDIVNVHVSAGRDVLAGETDDLAVLADRLSLGDGRERDLVSHADPLFESQD